MLDLYLTWTILELNTNQWEWGKTYLMTTPSLDKDEDEKEDENKEEDGESDEERWVNTSIKKRSCCYELFFFRQTTVDPFQRQVFLYYILSFISVTV